MLARLGHDTLIGGHDEHGKVDTADAGEHVLDEALVPRHVDDPDLLAVGETEPGKAEIERHLALFLFFQPVGIDAGERLHQRRFSVVYVARRADDVHAGSYGAENTTAGGPEAASGYASPGRRRAKSSLLRSRPFDVRRTAPPARSTIP